MSDDMIQVPRETMCCQKCAQLARFHSEEFAREVAEAVGAVILGGTWKTVSEPLRRTAAAAVRKLLKDGGSDD